MLYYINEETTGGLVNGFIMDQYFIVAPVYVDDLIMPCYNMDKCNNALEQDLKEQFKEKIFGFRNGCVLQD
jgi:hypothetical protein